MGSSADYLVKLSTFKSLRVDHKLADFGPDILVRKTNLDKTSVTPCEVKMADSFYTFTILLLKVLKSSSTILGSMF